MKTQNLFRMVWQLPGLLTDYLFSHAASRKAMQAQYFTVPDGQDAAAGNAVRLTITRCGDLYEVSQVFYRDGQYVRQQSWLAVYGWQGNGHLSGIGSHRFLIFNPPQQQLYLEEWLETPREVVTLYHQINQIP